MNETIRTILERCSVRKYVSTPLNPEVVMTLLEAGNAAPSGMNQKPRHFVAITDRKKLDLFSEMHPYAKFAKQAPLAIIVCGEQAKSPDYWQADCAAAAQNILLAATALGLGSCWCCSYPHTEIMDNLRNAFGIPAEVVPYAVVVAGQPAQENKRTHYLKKEITHINKW